MDELYKDKRFFQNYIPYLSDVAGKDGYTQHRYGIC